jgi:putative ABC transport system permease protein
VRSPLSQTWLRLKALFHRRQLDRDLNDELVFHLAMREEKIRSSHTATDDPRLAARRQFGNVTYFKEQTRGIWTFASLEALWRDFLYASRGLRKSAGFTATAILTLALGIGAPTAIFSVIDAVMLQPLPFDKPDELVRIVATKNGISLPSGPSPTDLRDYARATRSFQQLIPYDAWRKNVSFGTAASEPEQMIVGLVPVGYFPLLRISPVIGRLFTEEENQLGRHRVAAIGVNLWQRQFSGSNLVLGQSIRINNEPYTIVAVMPDRIPAWMESRRAEIWTPIAVLGDVYSEPSRGQTGFSALGRLKPGVSLPEAQADLTAIAARLAQTYPVDRNTGVAVKPLVETRIGELRPMLFLLMAAVTLILLIACSNLANLLLARNSVRQRELAMRTALGAGRGGLVQQLLVEALLLSFLGSAAGLFLSRIGLTALTRIGPSDLPQLRPVQLNSNVLIFTLLAALGTSVLFGLAPAFACTRINLVDDLKQGGRAGISRSRLGLRNILVASEMALSLMLLVGASLLIQSVHRLQREDIGVRQDHLLKGHFYMPPVRYPNSTAITLFCDAFANHVRDVPGVVEASVTTIYPPSNRWLQPIGIAGQPVLPIDQMPMSRFGLSDSHLLRTLAIPLLRGRDFASADTDTSPKVALISEEFRRRYFLNEDAIGHQVHIGPPPGSTLTAMPTANTWDSSDITIIGVIGNIKTSGLASPSEPLIIGLYSQHPVVNYGFKDILIRTAIEPHFVAPEIRSRLYALDSDMPFAEVQTMDEMVAEETGSQRFTTSLLSLFTLAGLALAVVGIYGVISYLVTQRNQEIAVRVALGATQGSVLTLIMSQGLKMAGTGVAIGLFGAWATRRFTSGLLFGISPIDPTTFLGSAVFLLAIAAIASAIPAMKAMRTDPVRALRQE